MEKKNTNMMNVQTAALAVAIQAKIPVLVWGLPGTGKTSVVRKIAEKLNLPLEVVIASIREPADFAGLPVLRDGGVVFEPPAWAKRLARCERGVLLLDEINCASYAVQAALLRVVLERVVGDLELHENVSIVATANPPEVAFTANEISAALANRFCHIDWTIDAHTWAEGFVNNFDVVDLPVLREDFEQHLKESRKLVARFIKCSPALLLPTEEELSRTPRAFPTPRSWELAARCLAACRSSQADEEVLKLLIAGCVGKAAASEFLTFLRSADSLFDPEDLLEDATKIDSITRLDVLRKALDSVVSAVKANCTRSRWERAWEVVARVAQNWGVDVAFLAAQELAVMRDLTWPAPACAAVFLDVVRAIKG